MLFLKRVTYPYEVIKCRMSGELIVYGDYYYEDDTDGVIVKATVFREQLAKRRKEAFDYTLLNKARSDAEYRQMLKKAEQEFLKQDLFERKIADQGEVRTLGDDF